MVGGQESANSERLRHDLRELVKARSLRFGTFTLASGRTSSYYIDARRTTMSAAGLDLIGRLGRAVLTEARWAPNAIGGLTLGADPVAYAIAMASRQTPPEIDAFTVRKEPKGHGTGQRVEGGFEQGHHVVIVEDVITTGGSALKAVEAVVEHGGHILGILAVIDREEGGRAAIEAAGFPVRSLVLASELVGADRIS